MWRAKRVTLLAGEGVYAAFRSTKTGLEATRFAG